MQSVIDVHAHLTDPSFNDIGEVILRAKGRGVERVVVSTTRRQEIARAFELARSFPDFISVAAGFDPSVLDVSEHRSFLATVAEAKSSIVAIGEVGLDHYYVTDHDQRALQEMLFRESIRLAKSLRLPLVIHSRSAGRLALEVLSSEGASRVLMHAFDGKAGDAVRAAEEGFFFSIPTSIVHSEQKQKLARLLPLERLMLETDSPVLGPERGTRNEPANLYLAAQKIAEIKRIPQALVTEVTTENARAFFPL